MYERVSASAASVGALGGADFNLAVSLRNTRGRAGFSCNGAVDYMALTEEIIAREEK